MRGRSVRESRHEFWFRLRAGVRSWGFPPIESVVQDLRFGARMLGRSPAFSLVAVVAIGLGIGINAGFFTLVDAFLFQPMPVANPDRLVKLLLVHDRGTTIRFSYTDLQTIARHSRTVEDAVAYQGELVALRWSPTQPGAASASAGCISGNYFAALGGTAVAGRTLTPNDESDGARPVVAISEGIWQRGFSRSPDVIGRDVVINGVHVTIVGVINSSFIGVIPLVPDLWLTLPTAEKLGALPGQLHDPANRFFSVRARLRPGVEPKQAAAELSGLLAEPAAPSGSLAALTRVSGVQVMDNSSLVAPSLETAMIAAPGLAIVALVLVIACANLANLLLSRALARQREIAVRLAIGASRRRLMRQLLTESALIALLGAALGLLLARWTVSIVSRSFFNAVPATLGSIALALRPSWRAVAYTVALVTMSVVLFGLAPAQFATSPNVTSSLKGEDAAFGMRIRRSTFRDSLVAIQVAACLILLAAAGTLVASLARLASTTTGLDASRVIMTSIGLSAREHISPALDGVRATFAQRVAGLPDVETTARAASPPFTLWPILHVSSTAGKSETRGVYYNVVTTRYFDVFGQRMLAGRRFSAADSATNAAVAIVSQATARLLWPSQPAVGQLLRVAGTGDAPGKVYQVVGVASDAHTEMVWDSDDNGYVFLVASSDAFATNEMPLLVRARTDLPKLSRAIEDIAHQVDPDSPLRTAPVTDAFASQLLPFKYGAGVVAGVGALGLGLAIIGLYGIVSFAVAQRRRELAVHVAMGATPRDVMRLVLRRELRLVVVGLAAGLVGAAAISKILAAIVLTVTPMSLTGFVLLPVVLFVVACIAIAAPAAGALRIAPMQVLRQE